MPKTNRQPKKAQRIEDVRTQTPPPDIPSSFESPESSTIAQAIYDGATEIMRVYFKRAGKDNDCYEYRQVPAILWADFVAADSKGRFFAERIRPFYQGVMLSGK